MCIPFTLDYSYVKLNDTYCGGEDMEWYVTLKNATLACNQNNECGVITDYECDEDYWATCRGNLLESSSQNSCSWIRPQFGKFDDLQTILDLIY